MVQMRVTDGGRPSMRSASGKIKHHGIVLEIAEDKIRLAATATFGASKKLTKTVSKTSMKYYLPVEPAELEEGMLYGPIKMEEGVEKEKWVYRRWAHWFEFKTLIQNDKGNGASVRYQCSQRALPLLTICRSKGLLETCIARKLSRISSAVFSPISRKGPKIADRTQRPLWDCSVPLETCAEDLRGCKIG